MESVTFYALRPPLQDKPFHLQSQRPPPNLSHDYEQISGNATHIRQMAGLAANQTYGDGWQLQDTRESDSRS